MADLPVSPISEDSEPTRHYDTVVEAWGQMLGEDLHYGYFASGDEALVDATDKLTDQMLERAKLAPELQVLDIGCGTGKAASRMVEEYEARVTGISPSSACIERATALVKSHGQRDRATFLQGDGTALSFSDCSFDRIWVMESSHLMQNKSALLSECARVLKPGGRVVLCDIVLQRKLSLEEVIEYRDEFLLLRDVFGRAIMKPLQFYREQFELLALEIESETDITQATYPTFDHWRRNANHNRNAICQLIGARSWTQFLASCDVLEKFWQEDILGYGILSAAKHS